MSRRSKPILNHHSRTDRSSDERRPSDIAQEPRHNECRPMRRDKHCCSSHSVLVRVSQSGGFPVRALVRGREEAIVKRPLCGLMGDPHAESRRITTLNGAERGVQVRTHLWGSKRRLMKPAATSPHNRLQSGDFEPIPSSSRAKHACATRRERHESPDRGVSDAHSAIIVDPRWPDWGSSCVSHSPSTLAVDVFLRPLKPIVNTRSTTERTSEAHRSRGSSNSPL